MVLVPLFIAVNVLLTEESFIVIFRMFGLRINEMKETERLVYSPSSGISYSFLLAILSKSFDVVHTTLEQTSQFIYNY